MKTVTRIDRNGRRSIRTLSPGGLTEGNDLAIQERILEMQEQALLHKLNEVQRKRKWLREGVVA